MIDDAKEYARDKPAAPPAVNDVIEVKQGEQWVKARVLEVQPRFLVWIIGTMGVQELPLKELYSEQWRAT